MGTTSSAIFNGNSRYSTDFQAVITRATAIATMPITQMQTDVANLTAQNTEMSTLGGLFTKLQTSVDTITNSLSGSSFQATVSDPTKLSATLGDGAIEGNYEIEVVDAGSYATSLGSATWTTDAGPTHTYQLSIGGQQYAVNAADNSAASVAAAINTQYSDKVRATVLNIGSTSAPDYRISLQAATLGDLQPDLLDNSSSVQKQQVTGVQAHYIVGGSGQDVYSSSKSVTIATGVTVNLIASAVGAPVNITVSRSTYALSSALQGFAAAYNAANDEVDKQHGLAGGPLAGQSVVSGLSNLLSQIALYSAAGSQVGNLAALGLDLGQDGHLTFNSTNFAAANLTGSTGTTSFLGSSTTQGFLKLASDSLNGVNQATTGLLPVLQTSVASEITRTDSNIADQQARVDAATAQMQSQMSSADALIASMEQTYNYLSGMFSAMQTASSQYR